MCASKGIDIMDQNQILDKVREILTGALGVDADEVSPQASLTRDLGAESIDFIDIVFRLEKAFDIKIPSGDLFPGNILNNEQFVQAGQVTEAGLVELKVRLPYLRVDDFSKNPKLTELPQYFDVQMILDYLRDRLNNPQNAAT